MGLPQQIATVAAVALGVFVVQKVVQGDQDQSEQQKAGSKKQSGPEDSAHAARDLGAQPQKKKMTKKALLIGCNYPNSQYELKGCVNDVFNMVELLKDYFGFEESNIKVLIDSEDGYTKPTGKNIKQALKNFVKGSAEGDIMYFHFSGHGVQVPDTDGDEEDGKDEALVATDINLISDDDLRAIIKKLHPKAKFTMISDCCHSGGMLDHPEVVIEGDKKDDSSAVGTRDIDVESFAREIPADGLLQLLNDQVEFEVKDATTMEAAQMQLFGKQASKRAKRKGAQMAMSALKIEDGEGGEQAPPARPPPRPVADDDEDDDDEDEEDDGTPMPDEIGVLITGCQSTETSADVRPGNDPNKACGALSNAIQTVVKNHTRGGGEAQIPARQLVLEARAILSQKGFTQNPCLECMEQNADKTFLFQE